MRSAAIVVLMLSLLLFSMAAHCEGRYIPARAEAALARAVEFFTTDVATHGGYLWRYSADLDKRWGETAATESQIWVQPPGTPSVGFAYLRAWKAVGDDRYLRAAKAAADALVWGQLECGGWDYKIDFSEEGERRWYYHHNAGKPGLDVSQLRSRGTFDDNTSQSALQLLIAVDQVTGDPDVHDAALRGLKFFLEAQFPNGAWPQWYPLAETGYSRYYTFNDNTINDCIATMMQAYRAYGDKRYLESALRGGEFIILSQIPSPQSGWAQQYDYDLKPAWARWFEPPAVCSAVTSRNIRTLVDLYLDTGQERFLQPIPAAIKWLQESKLDDGIWARFYELGTNKPLYVTVDKRVVHEYGDNIRPGYSWMGEYGVEANIAYYREVLGQGREAFLAARDKPMTLLQRKQRIRQLRRRVAAVIRSMDEHGRWVTSGQITCRTFITNVGLLSEYLGLLRNADDT